jgi:hypothetical protein
VVASHGSSQLNSNTYFLIEIESRGEPSSETASISSTTLEGDSPYTHSKACSIVPRLASFETVV